MSLLVVARDELAKLFATRRGWLSLAAFALLWAAALAYAIVPITRFLSESAERGLFDLLLGPLGLAGLAEWPAPQLAVYWIVALYLLPPFAVLVASDQSASDLGRGTLRFLALRASRTTLFLGRFLGQCLVQLGLVLVTLASVLVVVSLQLPARLDESLAAAPFIAANLVVQVLPWVALMALCSALAHSPRQATLYAVVAWIVVSLGLAFARDAFGPLAALDHVMPGSGTAALRGTTGGPDALALAAVPLVQGAVLLAIGWFAFTRRDL